MIEGAPEKRAAISATIGPVRSVGEGGAISRRWIAVAVALFALASAPVARAGTPVAGFTDSLVASGLSSPTAIAFLPSGKLLVTEKGGAVKLVSEGTVTTLTTITTCTASEMGLLGIAIDPAFTTSGSGFVYLYRTAPGAGGCGTANGRFNQVVRIQLLNDAFVGGSLTVLLTGIRTDLGNHDGGGLRIGPDNKLWVSVGDTGLGDSGPPGGSTNPYAQDQNALEGKILRLELTGAPAAGNPFIGQPGKRGEIYAYGFRNPFRMGFDPVSGNLWAGDVGQNTIEELDIVISAGNYSWPYCEGNLPIGCQQPGDIAPVFTYPQSGPGALGATVIAGAFSGADFGQYPDQYFFADYVASKVYRAPLNGGRNGFSSSPTDFVTAAGNPVDVIFGPGGAMYYVAIGTGQVRQVTPEYERPQSASPVSASLVPVFRQCGTGANPADGNHSPPLGTPACLPPLPNSTIAAVGAQGTGTSQIATIPGDLMTPADEADVSYSVTATDIRSGTPTGSDYDPNPTGADMTVVARLRLTDRLNGMTYTLPGTTTDLDFPVPVTCTATGGPEGANCNASTTADAVTPNAIREGRSTVAQVFRVRLNDAGANGTRGDGDDQLFAQQGFYVP
jgi:glucose/arabinose dehydrogenase